MLGKKVSVPVRVFGVFFCLYSTGLFHLAEAGSFSGTRSKQVYHIALTPREVSEARLADMQLRDERTAWANETIRFLDGVTGWAIWVTKVGVIAYHLPQWNSMVREADFFNQGPTSFTSKVLGWKSLAHRKITLLIGDASTDRWMDALGSPWLTGTVLYLGVAMAGEILLQPVYGLRSWMIRKIVQFFSKLGSYCGEQPLQKVQRNIAIHANATCKNLSGWAADPSAQSMLARARRVSAESVVNGAVEVYLDGRVLNSGEFAALNTFGDGIFYVFSALQCQGSDFSRPIRAFEPKID